MKKRNIYSALGLMITQLASAQHIPTDSLAMKFGSVVSGETLGQSVEVNVANSLFGQLSGLYVMQGSDGTNLLDDQASLNLRGISTLGNAAPLILIDGVERSLENIAISEVAKVEVLKDAVSSAIYGVRGANGVVMITTKKGKAGFHATVNYKMSVDTPFRLPKMADASTYAQAVNEAMTLDGLSEVRYSDYELGFFKNGTNRELYADVDWQDIAYNDFGYTHQADVQFQGGGDRFTYFTTLNYSNTTGILDHTDLFSQYNSQLNRVHLNVRTNMNVIVTNSTNLSVNLLGRLKEQNRPGGDMGSMIGRLYSTPAAAFPVKTGTGEWGGSNIYGYNPIAEVADRGTVKAIRRTLLADMTLRQDLDILTDGLYAEIKVAYDNMANYNDNRTRGYAYEYVQPIVDTNGDILGASRQLLGRKTELGWNSSLNSQSMYTLLQGRIGYQKQIGLHQIDATLNYEQISSKGNGRNNTRKRQSVMALANYTYNNKYTASAVVNYAGTAQLTPGSQFNTYPAVALGWIASEEDFLKDNNLLTLLKVNASYGLSGSDLFGHDLDLQNYGQGGGGYYFGSNNSSFGGLKEGDLAVVNLLAERSRKFDVGVQAALFNKLFLSATYFNEERSNILVSGANTVSGILGLGVPQVCEGVVNNQGVEFSFNIADQFKKFGYQISGNVTYAKNKIINNNEGFLPEDYLYKTGNSLNQTYGLEASGFYNSLEEIENAEVVSSFGQVRPGDVKYVDQNNDNIINEHDVVRIGSARLPEIYYGLNAGISYGKFSLMAQFQGVANRTINLTTANLYQPLKNNQNISTWYLEDNVRWTEDTKETANLPRLTTLENDNNFRSSTVWMRCGDFFKLRNLELAYDLDLPKMQTRLFLRGSNLFSIDKLEVADPENYGMAYPTMTSYSIGLTMNF